MEINEEELSTTKKLSIKKNAQQRRMQGKRIIGKVAIANSFLNVPSSQ